MTCESPDTFDVVEDLNLQSGDRSYAAFDDALGLIEASHVDDLGETGPASLPAWKMYPAIAYSVTEGQASATSTSVPPGEGQRLRLR